MNIGFISHGTTYNGDPRIRMDGFKLSPAKLNPTAWLYIHQRAEKMTDPAEHKLSPTCECAVCRLLFPGENCDYCGNIATDTFSLYDGTNRIQRHYCYRCNDALYEENERMRALIPPEEFADVRAANAIITAANNEQQAPAQDPESGSDY